MDGITPRPCPFCGAEAVVSGPCDEGGERSAYYCVTCRSCPVDGPERPTRAGAIAAWNGTGPGSVAALVGNRVDVDRVRAIQDELRAVNRADLRDLEFYSHGDRIEVLPEAVEAFRFTGLGNVDFIESDYWTVQSWEAGGRSGTAAADEAWLDDRVGEWHGGCGPGRTLAEYLGVTPAEYAAWVEGRSPGFAHWARMRAEGHLAGPSRADAGGEAP